LGYPDNESFLGNVERDAEEHHLVSAHVFPVLGRVNLVSVFKVPDEDDYRGCYRDYYSQSGVVVLQVVKEQPNSFSDARSVVETKFTLKFFY